MIKKNIAVLNSLRAFAALSVCCYHFICTITGFIKNKGILDFFDNYQYGVHTFFVISGFIVPYSMYEGGFRINNFFSFLKKRLIRLEPPYLFSIIIAVLILVFREKYFNKSNNDLQPSLNQVLLHIGYLIPYFKSYHWLNNSYWTLAIEFQFYVFIGLLFVPLLKAKVLTRVIFYAAVMLSSFLTGDPFLPYSLTLFLFGLLVFLYKIDHISVEEYILASLSVLSFIVYRYSYTSAVFSLIPVLGIIFFQDRKLRWADNLGKFSYSIYLIHPLIGSSFINILSHHFTAPLPKFLIILTGTLLSLGSAWLMYIFIEKPSKKSSHSIAYNK